MKKAATPAIKTKAPQLPKIINAPTKSRPSMTLKQMQTPHIGLGLGF